MINCNIEVTNSQGNNDHRFAQPVSLRRMGKLSLPVRLFFVCLRGSLRGSNAAT